MKRRSAGWHAAGPSDILREPFELSAMGGGMRIRVRVPATIANLGPGFDAMGLAVRLYNEIEAEPAPALEVVLEGEGADVLPRDATNRVVRSAAALFEQAGMRLPPMRLRCRNRIPLMSGLGSSAAAVVGGLALAAAWLGRRDRGRSCWSWPRPWRAIRTTWRRPCSEA
jgi:shikimate kinase